jgi:hypothetical protein
MDLTVKTARLAAPARFRAKGGVRVGIARSLTVGFLITVLASIATARGKLFAPEAHTCLLVPFDGSVQPTIARGSKRVSGSATFVRSRRFGQAARLDWGRRLVYAANGGNLPRTQGTIEFWIRPYWGAKLTKPRTVLAFLKPKSPGDYININALSTTHFGAAFAGTPPGRPVVWTRVDGSMAGWAANSWHHVAVTWQAGTLRLFLDGMLASQATGAQFPHIMPTKLMVIGDDFDLAELRISDVVRYHPRISTAAPKGGTYLASMTPIYFQGLAPPIGLNGRYPTVGRPQPRLALGGHYYARGLLMSSPSLVRYELAGRYARFVAIAGASALEPHCAPSLDVSVDGTLVYHSGALQARNEPLHLSIDVRGARELTLRVETPRGWNWGNVLDLADAVLLKPGAAKPRTSRYGTLPGTTIALYEPADAYQLRFKVPRSTSGMWLVPRSYLDDFDPNVQPLIPAHPRIALAAAPGEAVPAECLLLAAAPLSDVSVHVTGLAGPHGDAIAAGCFAVRRVVRTPLRQVYYAPPTDTHVVGCFLPPWTPQSIAADSFREIWLTAHVPVRAKPGRYRGQLVIKGHGSRDRCPVELTVYPFHLRPNPTKSLGIYIYMAQSLDKPRLVEAWLNNLKQYGVNNLVTDLTIHYARHGKAIYPDFTVVRRGLDLIRASGMTGTIVIYDGLEHLAEMLGHYNLKADPEVLNSDRRFWAVARKAMRGMVRLQKSYPTLHLAVSHLDEVFDNGRFPLYLELAKAVRQVPAVPLYATVNTLNHRSDQKLHEILPYVNILGNHGYTFEWWLARGHTFRQYKRELASAGDVAWVYHNDIGAYYTAKWARIINGFYLWASPFRVACPWCYQWFRGNPYNDTEGKLGSFGMELPGLNGHPLELVPTKVWEAMRQGGDDLRYIATLQALIVKQRKAHPRASLAAQRVLTSLRALITAPLKNIRKGWKGGVAAGTPAVSPLIHALAQSYSGAQWQVLRRRIAMAIITLQNAGK